MPTDLSTLSIHHPGTWTIGCWDPWHCLFKEINEDHLSYFSFFPLFFFVAFNMFDWFTSREWLQVYNVCMFLPTLKTYKACLVVTFKTQLCRKLPHKALFLFSDKSVVNIGKINVFLYQNFEDYSLFLQMFSHNTYRLCDYLFILFKTFLLIQSVVYNANNNGFSCT